AERRAAGLSRAEMARIRDEDFAAIERDLDSWRDEFRVSRERWQAERNRWRELRRTMTPEEWLAVREQWLAQRAEWQRMRDEWRQQHVARQRDRGVGGPDDDD
nr:hypothetical protein [Pseudomonadota bacterium]